MYRGFETVKSPAKYTAPRVETGNKNKRLSLFLSFLLHIYIVLFWLVSTLFSCQNCVSLRCCSFVEPFVVGLEFAVAIFFIVQVKK